MPLSKEARQKGNEVRQPIKVFENRYYQISTIPLNYRIDMKKSLEPQIPQHGIDRDWYSDIDLGLEEAKRVAEYALKKYFMPRRDGQSSGTLPRGFTSQNRRKVLRTT